MPRSEMGCKHLTLQDQTRLQCIQRSMERLGVYRHMDYTELAHRINQAVGKERNYSSKKKNKDRLLSKIKREIDRMSVKWESSYTIEWLNRHIVYKARHQVNVVAEAFIALGFNEVRTNMKEITRKGEELIKEHILQGEDKYENEKELVCRLTQAQRTIERHKGMLKDMVTSINKAITTKRNKESMKEYTNMNDVNVPRCASVKIDSKSLTRVLDHEQPQKDTSTTMYAVEKLTERRRKYKRVEYLVRWRKYSSDHDSWEPEKELLKSCPSRVNDYYLYKGTPTTVNRSSICISYRDSTPPLDRINQTQIDEFMNDNLDRRFHYFNPEETRETRFRINKINVKIIIIGGEAYLLLKILNFGLLHDVNAISDASNNFLDRPSKYLYEKQIIKKVLNCERFTTIRQMNECRDRDKVYGVTAAALEFARMIRIDAQETPKTIKYCNKLLVKVWRELSGRGLKKNSYSSLACAHDEDGGCPWAES